MEYTEEKLIGIGIEKLKKFGFIHVNRNNVFLDEVYKYHFKKFISIMLDQDKNLDTTIQKLFSSIDKKHNEHF